MRGGWDEDEIKSKEKIAMFTIKKRDGELNNINFNLLFSKMMKGKNSWIKKKNRMS